MTINRVTQHMMMDRSYLSLQTGLGRLSKNQEQLSTGRVLNRPSDSPTDTTAAMRMRAALADQAQYQRNAHDGLGRLGQIDTTLTTALDHVNRARNLGLQAVNAANGNAQSREALATEVDQLREALLDAANATYLGRPVFGGITGGTQAYDPSGAYVGTPGEVQRTVAKGAKVSVAVNGPDAFGPAGADVFKNLEDLSNALRAGDLSAVQTQLDNLQGAHTRITSTLTDVGTRYNRLERAAQAAQDATLDLTTSLSDVENVDIAKATMDLKMNEVAYQAALAATARLVQPSLADFLR